MTEPRRRQIIEADLTWTGMQFEPGVQVEVDDTGRITRVGTLHTKATTRLTGQALLPGFVNAHSHAFQRGLRGRGERFPDGAGSFWSWREAMYALVNRLDAKSLFDLSVQAFQEMRSTGITTVGEFHYLHHLSDEDRFVFDTVVLDAARAVGIRIALLQTYYRTGGCGLPATGGQRRFLSTSLEGYWSQVDRLELTLDPTRESLGIAAHSLRAVPPDEVEQLHAESVRRGRPFHIHLEEQVQEVADCLDAYDQRPMTLLLDRLSTMENVTAVHCTHTDPTELTAFIDRGGSVSLCPLTEANLGDGIPPLGEISTTLRGVELCLGTDSNARIAMMEEMRGLEYAQRLKAERRGIFRDEDGTVARRLLRIATQGGARSLGVASGEIRPGLWADFAVVDMAAPILAGADPDTLLDSIVFGADPSVVTRTAVGGIWDR